MDLFNWFKSSKKTEKYSVGDNLEQQIAHVPARGTAGITVNNKTALNYSAVWACVRVISETEATLPFPVYQRLKEGGKQRDRTHPVYNLLNLSPDGVISALQWREATVNHLMTWGNSYSEIEFGTDGKPLALHILPPDKVTPERQKDGSILYKIEGTPVKIPASHMLHFAGLGFDGLVGYSPIKMASRAIGLGLATEAFGSAWFENGAHGIGVLSSPKSLTAEARKNIKESLFDQHGGPENYGGWLFFEEGITATQMGIAPEESQFLQTRIFQIQEICRFFRVDPALIGELSRSTFSNVEQQSLNFVVHCIRPMCCRMEAEINRKLFQFEESNEFYAEHLIDGLLRGDTATRYSAYNIGLQAGFLCKDEVREWENLNPIPAEPPTSPGRVFLTPLNMAPAAVPAAPSDAEVTAPAPAAPGPTPEAVQASWNCVKDNLDRMLRREAEGVRTALKKFDKQKAVEDFYQAHQSITERALKSSLAAYAALVSKDIDQCMSILSLSARVISTGKAEIMGAIEENQDIETVLTKRLGQDWRI